MIGIEKLNRLFHHEELLDFALRACSRIRFPKNRAPRLKIPLKLPFLSHQHELLQDVYGPQLRIIQK